LPSTTRQAFGSPSSFLSSATPIAQNPPYWGAYFAGSALKASRLAALAKRKVTPAWAALNSALPAVGAPAVK